MTPTEIARKLTMAQRHLLLLHNERSPSMGQHWATTSAKAVTSWSMSGRGLMQLNLIRWERDPRGNNTVLTPLGLAVRAELMKEEG